MAGTSTKLNQKSENSRKRMANIPTIFTLLKPYDRMQILLKFFLKEEGRCPDSASGRVAFANQAVIPRGDGCSSDTQEKMGAKKMAGTSTSPQSKTRRPSKEE